MNVRFPTVTWRLPLLPVTFPHFCLTSTKRMVPAIKMGKNEEVTRAEHLPQGLVGGCSCSYKSSLQLCDLWELCCTSTPAPHLHPTIQVPLIWPLSPSAYFPQSSFRHSFQIVRNTPKCIINTEKFINFPSDPLNGIYRRVCGILL